MKNLITVSLFIFCIIAGAILIVGFGFNQPVPLNDVSIPTYSTSPTFSTGGVVKHSPAPATPTSIGIPTFSVSDVAKHNAAGDCWLIINNKVYDVSSYISAHPGGIETIASYCGQDATAGFNDKGNGRGHSQNADQILSAFYIGNLR